MPTEPPSMRACTPAPMARSVCHVSVSGVAFVSKIPAASRGRDLHCSFLSIDSGVEKVATGPRDSDTQAGDEAVPELAGPGSKVLGVVEREQIRQSV